MYNELLGLYRGGTPFSLTTRYEPGGTLSKELTDASVYSEWDNNTLVEFYAPEERLVIFGAGHIGFALAKLGKFLGFSTLVYDDRPAFANEKRFPGSVVICDGFDRLAENIALTKRDYIVIVTRGHKHDADCLRFALSGEEPYYLGMIGSRRRVAIVKSDILEAGFNAERLDKLQSPIGLNIGAVTPEEISLAIAGQLIEYRRRSDNGVGDFPLDPEQLQILAEAKPGEYVQAIVVATDGSVPRDEGARMLVNVTDGRSYGTIGGGCAEGEVLQKARALVQSGKSWLCYTLDLTDDAEDDGMVCGGVMEILLEVIK
ncbi:MAG: XdhC family protein [Oscillospiraceae bacterium]|jgi:xanthine dehydrogenase accessory factor|nr:XdhC family protein [Oscillospiraceae bacterium]